MLRDRSKSQIFEKENSDDFPVSNGMETGQAFIRKYLLFIFIASFSLGVFFSSYFKVESSFLYLLFFIIVSLFIYGFFFIKESKNRILFFIIPSVIFCLILGIVRYQIKDSFKEDQTLLSLAGQNVILEGIILNEPEIRENFNQAVLEVETVSSTNINFPVSGKVLIRAGHYPEIFYGDRVRIEGRLDVPEKFETSAGKIFDYESYLSKDEISFILSFGRAEIISSGEGGLIKGGLLSFKRDLITNIEKGLPEPFSALMNGILLGVKSSLGKDLEEKLRKTALIHIVVLSGYNITLVAQFVIKSLFFLSRRKALIASSLGIVLFAIMVGGEPSVVRASIMAILALLARGTGRRYDITRALFLAGSLMILWNPKVLAFDLGFQLSFIATMALIWLAPFFEKVLKGVTEKFEIRSVISATLSAQIFVLPLLLYHTGEISAVGVFVNALVLPIIPLIMLLGFIGGMAGFISSIISFPFLYLSHLLLFYLLKVVEFFSALPLASIYIPKFSVFLLVLSYLLLFFICKTISKKGLTG